MSESVEDYLSEEFTDGCPDGKNHLVCEEDTTYRCVNCNESHKIMTNVDTVEVPVSLINECYDELLVSKAISNRHGNYGRGEDTTNTINAIKEYTSYEFDE